MASPSQPLRVPAGKLELEYTRLYDAAYKLEKLETDGIKLLKVAEIKQFADSVLTSMSEERPLPPDASGVAPAGGVPAPQGPVPGAQPQPTAVPPMAGMPPGGAPAPGMAGPAQPGQ